MRHSVFGRKLSRDLNERRSLLNNLASNLLEKGEIKTTLAKAKFAKPYVEKIITKAKGNRLFKRRKLATLISRKAFERLNKQIVPAFKSRSGGYTRIIKLESRRGDTAPMAKIQLLELGTVPEVKKALKQSAKAKASSKPTIEKQVLKKKK